MSQQQQQQQQKQKSSGNEPLLHPRQSPLRPCFHVWKPRPAFKKSAPPPPDFRIAVVNAREDAFPTLQQLDDLLQSVPDDPPPEGRQLYPRLKHGWRNVILAVVDQGVVSFVRVADAGFGREKLFEMEGREGGGGGKRGGGRGRGTGRGQGKGGRGRGRVK